MAADYRTLKMALLADTSKFTSGLGKAERDTNTFSGKMKSIAKGIGTAFTIAGTAIAGMAAKLAIDGIKAYSDFAESSSKVNVIFGKNAKEIENWSKTSAKAFGQSRTQSMNAASDFAVMGKAAGLRGKDLVKFSKKLTVLSSDFASFYNTSPEDAIIAIGAALRGESEPIRRYGVLLNDATLKAEAMKMGIYDGKGTLDMSAKVMASYQTILKQTTDAQGDFTRTADGVANGQRTLTALWDDAQLTIGEALYPAVQDLIGYLTSPKGQKAISEFAEAFAEAIKTMAKYLPGVVKEVSKLVGKVSKQGLMAGLLSDPKIAIAAAAYGAGFIAGGPAGGAVAAIAAYAGVQGFENYGSNVGNDISDAAAWMSGNSLGQLQAGGKDNKKKTKLFPGRPGHYWSNKKDAAADLAAYEAGETYSKGDYKNEGGGGSYDRPKMRASADRLTPTINITVNGAADSRESARAIERTLQKIALNGGSLAGLNTFN